MKTASVIFLALAGLAGALADIIPTFSPIPISSPTDSSSTSTTPSSTTASASSTTSSSPPPSPTLIFDQLPVLDVDTCSTDFSITWLWITGGAYPVKSFTLSVTNINVTQQSPPSTATIVNPNEPVTARAIIPSVASGSVISTGTVSPPPGSTTTVPGLLESLTTSLNVSAQSSFIWNQVNLPQGWYVILATATDGGDTAGGVGGIWTSYNVTSEQFFIRNGSDTSCLAPIGPATTSTGTDTSSPGASNTLLPSGVGSLSSGSHVNRGAIAGGVIGALAAIVAILGACLWYRQGRRRTRTGIDDTDTGGPSRPNIGKWGVLGSFDSANRSRSAPKSTPNADQLDPVTVLNTSANSRPGSKSGFSLGDMGLAALGLAKPQESAPSAYTSQAKRNRRSRQSKHGSHGTIDSAGAIMPSSSSTSSPTSSSHGHFDPYINYRGFNSEELAYSPHEKGVPMRDLSPSEENAPYRPYIPSSDSLDSGAPGVGVIPIGYEPSPFVTPPPSEPASRHNSRSYSRTSLNNNATAQAFAAVGPSESSLSSTELKSGKARSKSTNTSPTSTHPSGIPDVPETPRNDSLIMAQQQHHSSHHHRASTPDALVYTLHKEQGQTQTPLGRSDSVNASGTGTGGKAKRAARKPVPSYSLEDAAAASSSETSPPVSPVYTYGGSIPYSSSSSSSKPAKSSRRRPPPGPSTESPSSSSSSIPAPSAVYQPHLHSLEHKDSAHSLASLRTMEGDLSGYGAVLGKEAGGKQMHMLIPDMPLPQN